MLLVIRPVSGRAGPSTRVHAPEARALNVGPFRNWSIGEDSYLGFPNEI